MVMAMVAWPSMISETIFGFTFRDSSSVAHVWRRSWKRTPWPESPARVKSRAKERLRRLEGLMMLPVWLEKMSPRAGRES